MSNEPFSFHTAPAPILAWEDGPHPWAIVHPRIPSIWKEPGYQCRCRCHRITEWCRLEGNSGGHLIQPLLLKQVVCIYPDKYHGGSLIFMAVHRQDILKTVIRYTQRNGRRRHDQTIVINCIATTLVHAALITKCKALKTKIILLTVTKCACITRD